MKINISMPRKLRPYFNQELVGYKVHFDAGQLQTAWFHLERAHILGQTYPWQHSYVHWKMLWFGIRFKSAKEIIGQLPRLLVGGVKSFVGKIPMGNTGGSNVLPLRPMKIPTEILEVFKKSGAPLNQ